MNFNLDYSQYLDFIVNCHFILFIIVIFREYFFSQDVLSKNYFVMTNHQL